MMMTTRWSMMVACLLSGALACGENQETNDWTDDPGGKADGQTCDSVDSARQDAAPVQIVGAGLPGGVGALAWVRPTRWTYVAEFSGTPNRSAVHEGDDYVHNDSSVARVDVVSAADGTVAYVRTGCPQSSSFAHNNSVRECGSGWGNHIIVSHGGGLFTRYGHLAPNSTTVVVGDRVVVGEHIAVMGNTGRSEVRHLHFELGTHETTIRSCGGSQSFDRVYAPGRLPFGSSPDPTPDPTPDPGAIECPGDHELTTVNSAGGRLCVDAADMALGPFSEAMVDACFDNGGGIPCLFEQWSVELAIDAFGEQFCPVGTARETETGYCHSGGSAYGPFPSSMVVMCKSRGMSTSYCESARWETSIMLWIWDLTH